MMRLRMNNKLYFIFILLLPLVGWGGSLNGFRLSSNDVQECIEPQNPYDEGTGHYAGFEWEMENSGNCDGNSESFNEGCEEYLQQLDEYDECVSNNE